MSVREYTSTPRAARGEPSLEEFHEARDEESDSHYAEGQALGTPVVRRPVVPQAPVRDVVTGTSNIEDNDDAPHRRDGSGHDESRAPYMTGTCSRKGRTGKDREPRRVPAEADVAPRDEGHLETIRRSR